MTDGRLHLWLAFLLSEGQLPCASAGLDRAGSCCAGGGAGLTVEAVYLGCMEQLLLGEALVDPLIVGLSDAYELLRLALHSTLSSWLLASKGCRVIC